MLCQSGSYHVFIAFFQTESAGVRSLKKIGFVAFWSVILHVISHGQTRIALKYALNHLTEEIQSKCQFATPLYPFPCSDR